MFVASRIAPDSMVIDPGAFKEMDAVDVALLTPLTEELPWLRGRDLDLELVMGRAVCDWIGWKR